MFCVTSDFTSAEAQSNQGDVGHTVLNWMLIRGGRAKLRRSKRLGEWVWNELTGSLSHRGTAQHQQSALYFYQTKTSSPSPL